MARSSNTDHRLDSVERAARKAERTSRARISSREQGKADVRRLAVEAYADRRAQQPYGGAR